MKLGVLAYVIKEKHGVDAYMSFQKNARAWHGTKWFLIDPGPSAYVSFCDSFYWADTPEGYDYWCLISKTL